MIGFRDEIFFSIGLGDGIFFFDWRRSWTIFFNAIYRNFVINLPIFDKRKMLNDANYFDVPQCVCFFAGINLGIIIMNNTCRAFHVKNTWPPPLSLCTKYVAPPLTSCTKQATPP